MNHAGHLSLAVGSQLRLGTELHPSLLRCYPAAVGARQDASPLVKGKMPLPKGGARSTDLRSHLLPNSAVRALQHERAPLSPLQASTPPVGPRRECRWIWHRAEGHARRCRDGGFQGDNGRVLLVAILSQFDRKVRKGNSPVSQAKLRSKANQPTGRLSVNTERLKMQN